MNLQEQIQNMTAKEIILAMTDSLERPPIINIDMITFGTTRIESKFFGLYKKEVCFGCAATNTICKIANKTFTKDNIGNSYGRSEFLNIDREFLRNFEIAINCLRESQIYRYNNQAMEIDIAIISNKDNISLPYLDNDYTQKDLNQYILLANSQ